MDDKLRDRLLLIAFLGLYLAAVIFAGLFIFSEEREEGLLVGATFSAIPARLLQCVWGMHQEK